MICLSQLTTTGKHTIMDDWTRSRRLSAVMFAIVLTVAAMTGCAVGGSEVPPSSPNTKTRYDPTVKPPTQSANDIRQRTDLHDEHASSWSRYDVVSDHSVRVFFYMGNPRCHGVRATVDEDTASVRITLYEGTLPNSPAECAALAESASLLITTHDPVGARSVIAG